MYQKSCQQLRTAALAESSCLGPHELIARHAWAQD